MCEKRESWLRFEEVWEWAQESIRERDEKL
jgi:hypothetical protein